MSPHKIKIPEKAIRAVAADYGLTISDLISASRKQKVTDARHTCMALIWWHTSASLADIAKFFGGRTHATVIHARQKVIAMEHIDRRYRQYLKETEATHFRTTRIYRKK